MTIAAGRTDVGRVRAANEDAFVTDPTLNLLVVADGMGGHRGGAIASAISIQTVHEFVKASRSDGGVTWPYGYEAGQSFTANQLRNAIRLAHRKIQAEGEKDGDGDGHEMGSTVVAAIVNG